MNDINALTVGGSRNIGYFSSVRLLDLGATVTFLLRRPSVFDNDETIQKYVGAGKARLVQGDALVKEDVRRAWTAAQGDDGRPIHFLIFTVGGTPNFKLTKGFVISPPNLVTQSLLNCLETLPTPRPNIIAITSAGVTRAGHKRLPLALKPLYSYLLAAPHADKCGTEVVLAHCAGWDWAAEDSPSAEVLAADWKTRTDLPGAGTLKDVVALRPALLTDGPCRADTWKEASSGKGPYKVAEGDLTGPWTVSRKDVAHFLVEKLVRNWDEWKGKRITIAY